MSKFKKGISQQFVDRLNAEYKTGGWWKSMADDRELFIAIRENYINVYLNGNSLLRLWLEGDQLVGETHYKYLLVPEVDRPYIKVINGKALIDEAAALFNSDLSDLAALKRAANTYSGDEKKGVHQIVMSNTNVIDVEIAFGAENETSGRTTAKRIDFAALRQGQSGPEVAFYEAKLFANKELRAKGEDIPVLKQLRCYETFLHNEQAALIDSYRTVCGNLAALHGVNDRYAPMLNTMRELGSLSILEEVRLVVFGFDASQKKGENWSGHRQKLETVLGNRLLLKGDAKKFTNGISSQF